MSKQKIPVDDRKLLLQMIDEAYQLPNWNETSLRSSLRRVNTKMAAWKPRGCKHCIAEIVVHCGYWKYGLRRRLAGEKQGKFPIRGSNWFNIPRRLTDEQWSDYLLLLEEQHQQLVTSLQSAKRKIGHRKTKADGHWSLLQRTYWLAIHDGYHTGQINLLKAMYRRRD